MKGPMITTRTANIWLDADGIMHKEFLPNAQETIEDARESGEIMRKLSSNKRTPLLVDFTQVRGVTPEARAYYSGSEAADIVLACAGITNSLIGKVIGNFFIGFNKPPTPGKIFTSEVDAITWLKQFSKTTLPSPEH